MLFDRHEGALVKIVVGKVMSELKRKFQLTLPKELIGVDDRVEEIMNLIDAKFKNTTIIGICGMGGIGKTTLAKVLYQLKELPLDQSLVLFSRHAFREDSPLSDYKVMSGNIINYWGASLSYRSYRFILKWKEKRSLERRIKEIRKGA